MDMGRRTPWTAVMVLLLASCAAPAVDSSGSAPAPTGTVTEREPAPDFTLALGDGGSFTLSESDKPVYLVFWAEWCPTCRRELPAVDAIAGELGDRVDFVAPAWKGTAEATAERATEFFRSGNIKWGLDAGEEIFELYDVAYQPVTYLIGADDTIVASWPGVRGAEEIRSAVEDLIFHHS